jgi:hypothetical protein
MQHRRFSHLEASCLSPCPPHRHNSSHYSRCLVKQPCELRSVINPNGRQPGTSVQQRRTHGVRIDARTLLFSACNLFHPCGCIQASHRVTPPNNPHKLTKTAGPLARRRAASGGANCTRASRRLQFAPATACWSRQPPRRFPGQAREAVFAA